MQRRYVLLAVIGCLVMAAPLSAEETDNDLKTTLEALKQRIKDQDRRIAELEAGRTTSAVATSTTAPSTTSQESQREAVRQVLAEMKTESNKTAAAMPKWLEGLKFGGDMRLRYDGQFYNWDNADGTEKKDRQRARIRLRAGVTKSWLDDQLEVGFRLATGENDDPTSTNQTLTGDYSKKNIWLDLAYAKYSPAAIKGLTLIGGKMQTPWLTNEIFFDSDVNPEGFWAEYTTPKAGPVEFFAGSGLFFLKETSDSVDPMAGIFQTGMRAELAKDVKYTLAGNYQYYEYYYASGVTPRGNDKPLSKVPDFRVVGLNNRLDLPVFGRPLGFLLDWSHNCGADDTTKNYQGENNAYAAGVQYGANKKKGDWSVKYRYAWLEANSIPGMWADSDFGFVNRHGHVIGGAYNILDCLTVGLNVYFTQPIFSPSTTNSVAGEDVTTTVLADLIWKF